MNKIKKNWLAILLALGALYYLYWDYNQQKEIEVMQKELVKKVEQHKANIQKGDSTLKVNEKNIEKDNKFKIEIINQ